MEEKIKEVIRNLRTIAMNTEQMGMISDGAQQKAWGLATQQIALEITSLQYAIGGEISGGK